MPLVLLVFALFASIFSLQKETLHYAEPFFLIGSRMLGAGLILMSYVFFSNRKQFIVRSKDFGWFAALAFCTIYLTNILEIWGINHMVSSKACLIYSLSPFFTAAVAFLILRETLTKGKWFGMAIGFSGLLPILYMQTADEIATGKIFMFSLPELALVGAVLCSVIGWVILKKVINFGYSPILANGISMTIGGGAALLHSYLSGESWQPLPVSQLKPFLIYTLIMCLISNVISYNLFGYLLKRFSVTFMTFAGLTTPIFASFFGWIFLDETVTWHFFVSISFFAIGLAIFHREEISNNNMVTT